MTEEQTRAAGGGQQRPPLPSRQDTITPLSPFLRVDRVLRRQERIRAELERSRAGDHRVPTWALALLLVLLVGGFVAFVALS